MKFYIPLLTSSFRRKCVQGKKLFSYFYRLIEVLFFRVYSFIKFKKPVKKSFLNLHIWVRTKVL